MVNRDLPQACLEPCECGSGHLPLPFYDYYDIFLFYACSACYARKRGMYREDIFRAYQCEEPIESED